MNDEMSSASMAKRIDAVGGGGVDLLAPGHGRPCCLIELLGDGDLAFVPVRETAGEAAGTVVTRTGGVAGDRIKVQAARLASGTTALPLMVYWP